jgi:hypothetical protein
MITTRTTASDIESAQSDPDRFSSLLDEYRGLWTAAARRAAGSHWQRLQDEAIAGAMEGFWCTVQQWSHGSDFTRDAFVECYRAARRQVRATLGSGRLTIGNVDDIQDDHQVDLELLSDAELVRLLASGESISSAARLLGQSRRSITRRANRIRAELLN